MILGSVVGSRCPGSKCPKMLKQLRCFTMFNWIAYWLAKMSIELAILPLVKSNVIGLITAGPFAGRPCSRAHVGKYQIYYESWKLV